MSLMEEVKGKISEFHREVIRPDISDDEIISKCVKKCFDDICKLLEIPRRLIELFEKFWEEDRTLLNISGYREHYIHQFHVFLIGYYIINLLKPYKIALLLNLNYSNNPINRGNIRNLFKKECYSYKKLCNSLGIFEDKISSLWNEDKVLKVLFLMTMWHDNAQFSEKLDDWLKRYVETFYINWDSLLRGLRKYLRSYSNMLINDGEGKITNIEEVFENQIYEIRNHGVISSLLFLKEVFSEQKIQIGDEFIYREAALAMALHNFPIWEPLTKAIGKKIDFFDHPMQYLLMYCDFVQEWGRTFHRKQEVNRQVRLVDIQLQNSTILTILNNPKVYEATIGKFITDVKNSWACNFGDEQNRFYLK